MAAVRGLFGQLDDRPTDAGSLGQDRRHGVDMAPALQETAVRNDVVRVHAGVADDDVGGNDQRDVLRVLDGGDKLLVALAGDAVEGRGHVPDEDVDAIGVALHRRRQQFREHLEAQAGTTGAWPDRDLRRRRPWRGIRSNSS